MIREVMQSLAMRAKLCRWSCLAEMRRRMDSFAFSMKKASWRAVVGVMREPRIFNDGEFSIDEEEIGIVDVNFEDRCVGTGDGIG